MLAAFDRKGKEVYFDQDPQHLEYRFEDAMQIKDQHQNWTMRTDDWGYFQRAYYRVRDEGSDYWYSYNVFIAIIVTTAVTGFLWLIASIIEIVKFGAWKWRLAAGGLTLCIINLLFNMGGSAFIYYRICTVAADVTCE